MELQLVNQEIAESRIYRSTQSLSRLNGRDVADLLFLHTLMVYMLCRDSEQGTYGIEYAEQTSKYGGYSSFKTSGTDLYILAFALSNPDSHYARLHDAHDSKKFIESLHFNKKAHWQFIKSISRDDISHSQASSYFIRLESQLKIKDSRYKKWRRTIVDWSDQSGSIRRSTAAGLKKELQRIAVYGELLVPVGAIAGHDINKDQYVPLDKPSLGDKITGAAIGAIAGRFVASKIADRTGGDRDKMKNIGTGLGAIAGYWNAGRQRKQS